VPMPEKRRSREVLISVDIEASGPIPGAYSMLSLGACVIGAAKKTFYVEIKPVSAMQVPEAMAVVGQPLAHFRRNGVSPRQAMKRLARWVLGVTKGGTPIFVGFNATFDWAFVNWYFHTYLGRNPFGFGGLDIKSYFMGASGCSWDDTRSSRLPRAVAGGETHTHHALADAIEQAGVFEAIRRRRSRRTRRMY
jgi:ribonuclease T